MDKTELTIGGLLAAIILSLVVFVVKFASVERACLEAGYPKARVDYTFSGYCVKRVDQTDVVVPVGEARR